MSLLIVKSALHLADLISLLLSFRASALKEISFIDTAEDKFN